MFRKHTALHTTHVTDQQRVEVLQLFLFILHMTFRKCQLSISKNLYFSLGEKRCWSAKSLQACPTLCNSMDCSPPGSFVHGILQARILEWVAIAEGAKNHSLAFQRMALLETYKIGEFLSSELKIKFGLTHTKKKYQLANIWRK